MTHEVFCENDMCCAKTWPVCAVVFIICLSRNLGWGLPSTIRYRARVAYDGAGFHGFQLQSGQKRTVQLVLEQELGQRFNEPARVVAAGRTDAGVHAKGQAIHFDLNQELSADDLRNAESSLRRMLPQDIRLYSLQKAPEPFTKILANEERVVAWNTIYDSLGKLYSYRLSIGGVMHPLDRHNRWHPDVSAPQSIDPTQLCRIVQHFVGTHDFRAFASAVDSVEQQMDQAINTERTVYSVDLIQESETYFRIDFKLKGALYKQVRNMVGTAVDVCRGRVTEKHMLDLLGTTNTGRTRKDNLSKPAPPQGLTLEQVYFDESDPF